MSVSVLSYHGCAIPFFLWVWHLSTSISAHRQQFHTTTYIFPLVIMSTFLLEKEHMRVALLFCFNLKKSAAESHRMLAEVYDDSALSEITCRLVLSVQRRQFWPEWQEAWKSDQEGWGPSIADSFGRGRYPIARNACRAIGCDSTSHFRATTFHGQGFPHGNAPSHTSKMVRSYLETFNWEVGSPGRGFGHGQMCCFAAGPNVVSVSRLSANCCIQCVFVAAWSCWLCSLMWRGPLSRLLKVYFCRVFFFWASSMKRCTLGTLCERYNFLARLWWTLLSLYAGTASIHCTVVDCCRWLSASARVLHSCFLIFDNSMNLWLRRWTWCSVYVPKHVTRWPLLKD